MKKLRLLIASVATVGMSLSIGEALGQVIVKGQVSDAQGSPLIGATVTIQGSSQGTVTDIEGNYTLEAPGQDATLVFSFVGMKEQTEKVGSRTRIDITLKEDVDQLEAVIVTGYQDIKERFFTGASQSVSVDKIRLEGVPDVGRMLEGRVAGVNIQNVTGTFGAAPRITIRGSSSILGDTRPIWVIDGAIQEEIVNVSLNDLVSGNSNTLLSSAVSGLNASDIQSIEVLKDASATALYGARALNGVVVITTKSGKRNQPLKATYTGEFAIRPVPSYRNYDLLDSKETMGVYRQIESSRLTIDQSLQGRFGGAYTNYYRSINTYDPETGTFLTPNDPGSKARFLQKYELANTDWFDELFRVNPTQTHSISLTGGGEKSAQYASLSYYTDPGWTVADKVNRITGNLRSTYFFSPKVKATLQLRGSYREQAAPGTFERTSDPFTGGYTRDFDINPFSYALNTSRALRLRDDNGDLEYFRYNWAPFNIIDELNQNTLDISVLDLKLQGEFEYNITGFLKFNFLGTARYAKSISEHKVREPSNVVKAYNADETTVVTDENIFLYQPEDDPEAIPISVLPNGGFYNKRENSIVTYTMRNTLDYEKEFNLGHALRVYAGQEIRYTDRQTSRNDGFGYQYARGGVVFTDPLILSKLAQNDVKYFEAETTRERGVTFFATATYSYKDRYVLNVTGNYEGSNRAGRTTATRWLPTYNVGAKWNIHEEPFMQGTSWLSKLAFRPSYGLNAIIARNVSNVLVVYQSSITDRLLQGDRENQVEIEDLQNSELTWEKNYELNLGLDAGFLDNRINLTLDAYFRNGVDLIDEVRTSAIGGEFQKLANNADMITNGVEIQLNTVNIRKGDFQWSTTLNVSYFYQEIKKLEQQPRVFDLVTDVGGSVVGLPRGALFSFQLDRLNAEGIPIFQFNDDRDPIREVDFKEILDIRDYLKYEGPVEPNFTGGISNSFSYKNWEFSFFLTGQAGNVIRLAPAFAPIRLLSDLSVFSKEFRNRWLIEGDENRTHFPAIPSPRLIEKYGRSQLSQVYNAYNYSDQRVADGGFLRLKNVSLSYRLPKKWLDKLKLSTVRIGVQGTNLALLYADSKLGGQDPEFFRNGGVAYPITAQYTLSLNVGI